MTSVDHKDEHMAGLEKGLAIIEAFGIRESRLTLTEAATIAGCSRAAARRCLRTLVKLGYATNDGKYFRLAPRILRIGHAYVASNPLTRIVQPIIETASESTQQSVSVAVLDDTQVVVIARTAVHRSLSSGLSIGSRLPAYCSANGRVLLSTFDDIEIEALLAPMPRTKLTVHTKFTITDILNEIRLVRTRGYALNDQEVELGLRTIAMPLRDSKGEMIASISISVMNTAVSIKELVRKGLPALGVARGRIADLL